MALRAAVRRSCGSARLLSCGRHGDSVCVSQRSSSSQMLVDMDSGSGVAVMRLQSPPVNAMSLDFLTEFVIALEKLEMDKSCRGVIITSSVPKIFSGGLDIMELYGRSPERLTVFWRAFQELWLKLYGSSMATIAAVNGASPAGGCLVAISCDYRIMADAPRYRMGLNETQLGITLPPWMKDTMLNTVGHRATELSAQLGLLYNPQEALKIGLVDQVVPEDQVLPKAREMMDTFLSIPEHARQLTKSQMRKTSLDKLTSSREADVQGFLSIVTRGSTQKALQRYLEMLKKRKS
ncbi:enoyl-CoA delta isomerase 1, mitochondrial [Genypterus blacodes]|uniref:enoyl-CoA delta isomerase 1, mitochondrial n=1 Tax=Genypterus blacodes TaxID=154954 RepID=UPI003F75FB47